MVIERIVKVLRLLALLWVAFISGEVFFYLMTFDGVSEVVQIKKDFIKLWNICSKFENAYKITEIALRNPSNGRGAVTAVLS